MINQPEPVFSFTIPYYTSNNGETDELFVSEKTYVKYLQSMEKLKMNVITGSLHPVSPAYGEVTTTLFDEEKALVIIGTKDQEEYTNELLDISIAQELEKIILYDPNEFFRFLYSSDTPELIQTFIDDIQQTLEEIPLAKRLKKAGYRIGEREQQIAKEIFVNAPRFSKVRHISPYENEQALFLLSKLIFLANVEEKLFSEYKKEVKKYYPLLFSEVDQLLNACKKINLSTAKGRERALTKIFSNLKLTSYIKKINIGDVKKFRSIIEK